MMQDYQQELAAIKDLLSKNPEGMSVTDISKALKKNKNTVGRYLDILLISGQVDMRTFGMAKVYTISRRVPLSAMLSYSRELIMVLDDANRIIDINDNFLALLELPREQAVGKNIAYLQSPAADTHELLGSIAKNGGDREITITFPTRDRGERIFHQKCIPTVFDDGKKAITVMLTDVTEHILAEREIRDSEERFRMMADNIQDGLIIMENGTIIYANKRIAEITGYSIKELWALKPIGIIAPEYREKAEEHARAVEAHPEKPRDLQTCIVRKDGERRFVHTRVSGVRHHDRFYNFIVFTDVTEHRLQDARIAESEERFRMMADNIQDGLIIVENDRIVFSNRRIKEITGYTTEEIARQGIDGTLQAEDITEIVDARFLPIRERCQIREVFQAVRPDSPEPCEFKIWIRRKDGERRYIHGKVTAARRGDITSYYITIADITGFAEREKVLRERIDALQELLH
ncbi:PAS domain S-box protein [Methanoregula sp. PtaB.Bin085]|uniref:PAS domain S-box protein n=1 Tax=Methanoregula sp. PtaB.Bin085 TaxID=1811680 RepID=UPI0009C89EC8|nr:PAS domain S-box protein [Methanoregula sp. PtaB.Bin085]OPX63129.1 MAG: cyclic-di-GMP phosphodiesterase [Methanoregula sp. PtaB.Bin085]